MKKEKWYNNKKDLATKPIFNICWFGFFLFGCIIGAKGIANLLGWESYFVGIFSALMLGLQQHWYMEILELHNKRRDSKNKQDALRDLDD